MRILANGNVGIGTTTPATKLDVNGDITVENVKSCDSSTQAIGTDGTGKLVCDTSLSDARLKDQITSLDSNAALNIVNSLNPVSFYWKDPSIPGTGSTQQQFGFIAQDVAKVAPNLVATTSPTYLTPDGTYYLNYQGVIPLLAKAIQGQQAEIGTATSSFSSSLAVLTATQGSLASNASSTVLSLASLSANYLSLSSNLSASVASTSAALSSLNATFASSTLTFASSTASTLSTSTSFIQTIANAVIAILQSSGQAITSAATWTVGEIHAGLAVFTHVDTQSITTETAAVSNGLEMTDQATGQVYCVQIVNGDFQKTPGTCAAASSTPAAAPQIQNSTSQAPNNIQIINPNNQANIMATSTASSTVSTSTATSTSSITATVSATSTAPAIPSAPAAIATSSAPIAPVVTPSVTSATTTISAPIIPPAPDDSSSVSAASADSAGDSSADNSSGAGN